MSDTYKIHYNIFRWPIESLNLSVRAYNCLKQTGYNKVGDFLGKTREDLLRLRNMSEANVFEIEKAIAEAHLRAAASGEQDFALHVLSIINSDGYCDGKNSQVAVFRTKDLLLDIAYHKYCEKWAVLEENEELERDEDDSASCDANGNFQMNEDEFKRTLEKDRLVCIQLPGYHIQYEYHISKIRLDLFVSGGDALHGPCCFHESIFSRTYAFGGDEKAFLVNMGGYSIYGSCLDGRDPAVRLERYMAAERDCPDG